MCWVKYDILLQAEIIVKKVINVMTNDEVTIDQMAGHWSSNWSLVMTTGHWSSEAWSPNREARKISNITNINSNTNRKRALDKRVRLFASVYVT